MNDPVVDLLTKANNNLTPDTWCVGKQDNHHGQYCALGQVARIHEHWQIEDQAKCLLATAARELDPNLNGKRDTYNANTVRHNDPKESVIAAFNNLNGFDMTKQMFELALKMAKGRESNR